MYLKMQIKNFLNKLNFSLGNKPRVLPHSKNVRDRFIPHPYRTVLIISCDFELIWAWKFAKEINCDLAKARMRAAEERENFSLVLELSKVFNIPITWATVGHLFLESCTNEGGLPHKDMPRLSYFKNKYWKFVKGDWFDGDPCCNWQNALEWYAPDLIKKIIDSGIKHEIACHTFSHIDCRNKICPEEVFRKELQKYKEVASKYGIPLKSFVFPGNLIGNVKVLKEEGFASYRVDKDILGFPQRDKYGLWEIPTTAEIGPYPYNWGLDYYIKRYKTILENASEYGRLCHFWFHVSTDREFLKKSLFDLFNFIDKKREHIYITTIKDYVQFLENGNFLKNRTQL